MAGSTAEIQSAVRYPPVSDCTSAKNAGPIALPITIALICAPEIAPRCRRPNTFGIAADVSAEKHPCDAPHVTTATIAPQRVSSNPTIGIHHQLGEGHRRGDHERRHAVDQPAHAQRDRHADERDRHEDADDLVVGHPQLGPEVDDVEGDGGTRRRERRDRNGQRPEPDVTQGLGPGGVPIGSDDQHRAVLDVLLEIGDRGATPTVDLDPGRLGAHPIEDDDDRADHDHEHDGEDAPCRAKAVDVDQCQQQCGGGGEREADEGARQGCHESPPTVEPLRDHRSRRQREQPLAAEAETTEPDRHHDDAHRGTHRADHAQAEQRRRQTECRGERHDTRPVPVDRPAARSEEQPTRAGADEVGDRNLQPCQAGGRDQVIGEDADASRLARDRRDRTDRSGDHDDPAVVERRPSRIERPRPGSGALRRQRGHGAGNPRRGTTMTVPSSGSTSTVTHTR